MKGHKQLMSSRSDEWATPGWLFDILNGYFHFDLDPCASAENHKCEIYYTKEDDGLAQPWNTRTNGSTVAFVNPPYTHRQALPWIKKAIAENKERGVRSLFLLPARTETKWFWELASNASDVFFIGKRLKFNDGKGGATFPSVLMGIGLSVAKIPREIPGIAMDIKSFNPKQEKKKKEIPAATPALPDIQERESAYWSDADPGDLRDKGY